MARAPALSRRAKELLDAANDASGPARNAWVAFLALLAYLLVTLGGVSHEDLLLNNTVRLPIIDVEIPLPLFSFFQYAPALLLLVYLSLLIQHVILARKYREFKKAIAAYENKARREHSARELVHSYVVSQLLAGPKRNLITDWLMRLMVFVTFILLPVVTLLYFQVKFLPYHEVLVTYWHRIAVLICLAMLFAILPIISLRPRKREVRIGPQGAVWQASPLRIAIGAIFATMVLGFSWLIATVPDEGLDRLIGFVPQRGFEDESLLNPLVRAGYERMPEADNFEDRRWLLRWLIAYRVLVVEDIDMVPDEDDAHGEVSVVLRDRDFRFARLNRSDLHRADLTEADLSGAELWETRLEKAKLKRAQLYGAHLGYAKLQGADLEGAKLERSNLGFAELQGADLEGTWVQGADLGEAQLQSANLKFARLQDADLQGVKLQGADLEQAKLNGADLRQAQLQGANLEHANLQGANLGYANLQGANLEHANLQGANLGHANLQGAYLGPTDLQGANLRLAGLQGADLLGAQLQGAELTGAHIWLASFYVYLTNRSPLALGVGSLDLSPLTRKAKVKLKEDLQANITDERLLAILLYRLDPILRDDPPEWKYEDEWNQYVSQATEPSPDELVSFLADMACEYAGTHLVISMLRRAALYSEIELRRQYVKPLIRSLLDENCIGGVLTLTDETRSELRELVSATE